MCFSVNRDLEKGLLYFGLIFSFCRDSGLLHNLISGEGGKNYSGVFVLLSKGAEAPAALLWMASTAVSSWKNSSPNWRRHYGAVGYVMVVSSGGRRVPTSALSSPRSPLDGADPPLNMAHAWPPSTRWEAEQKVTRSDSCLLLPSVSEGGWSAVVLRC